MSDDTLLVETDKLGLATVTMNKPQLHNAFDDRFIDLLTATFKHLGADPHVRCIVLQANGQSFSAGADLNWMKRMAAYSEQENLRDAMALALLMETIDKCPKPTVAVVQGPAYGGGVGLVAACDMAIASEKAGFCLTEVRLGLIPAVISPYVLAAMGARACRRYFLTAERFSAQEAWRLGLIHELATEEKLPAARNRLVQTLLKNGPEAQNAAKDLIRVVAETPSGPDLMRYTAQRIAQVRASQEGQEGISAFLEKRPPSWCW